MIDLNGFAKEIHQYAVEKGFYERGPTFPEIIALCHSELSEALEEYRNKWEPSKTRYSCQRPLDIKHCSFNDNCADCIYGKPEGIPSELADCIIRILDSCAHYGIDIEAALRDKQEYNQTRPYMHGGKTC
jgi:NTP pyrophosphatase (non-canonical NTP hydrolase)